MNNATLYLETHSTDPCFNLAFEEFVLRNRPTGDYLILWQNDKTVVVGQNQNTEAEINRPFVEAHGIRVVRRSTGGGAVYHDLGNLNYSFITDVNGSVQASKNRLTAPIVRALKEMGLDAESSGRNDILVAGRKVSGTAQRLYRNRILHHGTLLFDADAAMVSGALRPDPEKFKSRSAKSVASRIGNIRSFLTEDMTLEQFWKALKQSLAQNGLVSDSLTGEELSAVERLRREKYNTWEWNFGASPPYNFCSKRKWPGGLLEVRVNVANGRIENIAFYGDFLSLAPTDGVARALRGCVFLPKEVETVLQMQDIPLCFGGIGIGEILETIFFAPTERHEK